MSPRHSLLTFNSFPTQVLCSARSLIMCERKSLATEKKKKKGRATERLCCVVTAQCLSEGKASISHPVKTEAVCVCGTPVGRCCAPSAPRQTWQKEHCGSAVSKIKPKTLTLPWHPDKTRSLRRLTQIRRKALIKADNV